MSSTLSYKSHLSVLYLMVLDWHIEGNRNFCLITHKWKKMSSDFQDVWTYVNILSGLIILCPTIYHTLAFFICMCHPDTILNLFFTKSFSDVLLFLYFYILII